MKQHLTVRVGRGCISLILHRRTALVLALLLAACAAVLIISTGVGDMTIRPLDVIRSVAGKGAEEHMMVVRQLRLPRILVALLFGASLAAAGAIVQGIIRNPLASPDIIGVTGGASVAAVVFITYFAGLIGMGGLPAAAMAGGAIVSIVLYALAWKKGVTPLRLILVGVGLGSLMSALTTMMLVFSPNNDPVQAYLWLTGSVYGADWQDVRLLLPWTVILIPLAFSLSRHVNIQQLGDDMASGVGSRVQLHRGILLLISVALAGAAVSVAGGIGFIGLVAPHMARKLVGSAFGSVLPVSALIGAIIVMLADLAGRTLFLPLDVPAGVFTAAVGAPFFIYLLYTRRNAR